MSEYEIGKDILNLQIRMQRVEEWMGEMSKQNESTNKPRSAI